jgi:uncharacterized SAM-binding protein YcdF (DUF218 family)
MKIEQARAQPVSVKLVPELGPKVIPGKAGRARFGRFLRFVFVGLASWMVLGWIGAHLLIVKADLSSADAIVVMSGSATFVERTTWAAKLYREGRAPMVILTNDGLLSGWHGKEQRNPYFYELASRELQQQGVPAHKIQIVSGPAFGTYEESLGIREFAKNQRLKRLLVVTSAYHSRRALWSMRRACEGSGIQVGIDSPPPGLQTPPPTTWWLRRRGWHFVAAEYVKIVYYWLKY